MQNKRKFDDDMFKDDQAPLKRQISRQDPNIERLLESTVEVEPLTERKLKDMIVGLDKAIRINQDLRLKHAEDPRKFMESEIDVDMRIKDFMPLATYPHLYPVLTEMNIISPILSLLTHENLDIVIDTLELIKELTDDQVSREEITAETDKPLHSFVDALISNDLISVLQFNLERFDERQDSESSGVFSTLSIMENMLSLKPELSVTMCSDKKLVDWLLNRITYNEFDANKQYASEIIAILLQVNGGSMEPVNAFVSANGLQYLLKGISLYRKHDPKDADELEYLENLFDATCSCLRENDQGLQEFLKSEGVESMCLLLKHGKTLAAQRAIKVLSFALAGEHITISKEICNHFVDNGGLKHFFNHLFRKSKKSDEFSQEYCITILNVLIRDLDDSLPSFRRSRLINKFEESEYEKLKQLIDLFGSCLQRFNIWSDKNENVLRNQYQEVSEEEFADIFYVHAIESGLLPVQQLALVVTELYSADNKNLKTFIGQYFESNSSFKDILIRMIEEYATQVDNTAEKLRSRKLLLALDMNEKKLCGDQNLLAKFDPTGMYHAYVSRPADKDSSYFNHVKDIPSKGAVKTKENSMWKLLFEEEQRLQIRFEDEQWKNTFKFKSNIIVPGFNKAIFQAQERPSSATTIKLKIKK